MQRDTRYMIVVALIVLGVLIGSFLNVLGDRLPKGQDVLWGRSRCDHCRKTLRWFELVPIVSFLVQKGRCLRCHKKLSFQYPLVELATAAGFGVLGAAVTSSPILLVASLIIFSSFLVIFIADFKYQIIPDSMTIMALMGSLMWIMYTASLPQIIVRILIGAICSLFFYVIWFVTRGRGMGFGDVKLAGVLGLLLGFPAILFALYSAFLTGAGAGVILMIVGRKTLKSKIAFGPFLLVGVGVTIIFRDTLFGLWNSLF